MLTPDKEVEAPFLATSKNNNNSDIIVSGVTETTSVQVLHGTCHFNGEGISFFLWTETSGTPASRDGAKHTFSGNARDILSFSGREGLGIPKRAKAVWLAASMPTLNGQPAPSGEMDGLLDTGENSGNSGYATGKWEIEGIMLKLRDALRVVAALEDSYPEEGVIVGSDLRYWRDATALLTHFLSQQKFLPTITEDSFRFRSRWILFPETDQEQGMIRDLVKSMPGACIAFDSGAIDRESIVRNFLDASTDVLCREFAGRAAIGYDGRSQSDAIRWVSSLASKDSTVTLDRSLVIQKIESWTRRIRAQIDFPFRMSFDVIPPEGSGDRWILKFVLQSRADPSLRMPFSRVWDRRDREAQEVIRKYVEYPEEFLLQSLGTVQAIFPPIGRSMRSPNPSELSLDPGELYSFLNDASLRLNESGFSVMLPEWWVESKKRLGLRVKARPVQSTSVSRVGFEALLRYSLDVVFDGEPISPDELERLAGLKTGIVRIGQKWARVDQEEVKRILSLIKGGDGKATLAGLLSLDSVPGSTPIVEISGEGWVGDIISGRHKMELIEQPRSLTGKLRDYQRSGASWMKFTTDLSMGCCLADDMGLGKTIEVIAFLLERRERGEGRGPVLIVCPTSVISNWVHEVRRFAPSLNASIHHGPGRLKGEEFAKSAASVDMVITSYALLQRDSGFISKVEWEGVVCDEAQYIKNYSTKQSRAVRSLKAAFRVALTGTPVENRLDDLRSIFEFINPGYLPGEKEFRRRFALPVERDRDGNAAKVLNRLVSPFILRREKSDRSIISDLPGKEELKTFIPVTKEQASLYEATVKAMIEEVEESEGIQRKGIILATITKLKRLLDHPALVSGDKDFRTERSEKIGRLLDMVSEIMEIGEKVIIFTQYVGAGRIIKESIQRRFGQECLFLSGATPRVVREEMIARFQEPSGPRTFVISLKAGGFGINLTAASSVIHFDRWWNPAVEDQATDRAYRIGQKKDVRVYKFIASGTIEERIDEIIETKNDLRERIIGSKGEEWITELSTSQLRDIFSLRKDVIAEGGE